MRQHSIQLLPYLLLLGLPWIQGEIFQRNFNSDPFKTDGCPRHLRLCNAECLDRSTNHTSPCHTGPWGKCLSANFPFYCNLTDTCIRKDQMCGDHCFDGSPGSFWYDHTNDDIKEKDYRKPNLWKLEDNTVYDKQVPIMPWSSFMINKWLARYNCNGKCITSLELCNGGCDHPKDIVRSGTQISGWDPKNIEPPKLVKCGNTCKETYKVKEFHDCGDECLPRYKPCNGTCPDSTRGAVGPQWLCGNECRPTDQKHLKFQRWQVCPDGTCRNSDMNCEGPLPGTCPDGDILCRHYDNWILGRTDFSCWSSSDFYICNEIRNNSGFVMGTKHNDDWCFRKNEPCQDECIPGYIKCRDAKYGGYTCKNSTEYIQCGDECRESANYFICDGTCKSSTEMCNGVCTEGFEKCGKGCVRVTESAEYSNVDCNGECQRPGLLCNGECPKPGWFKALEIHSIRSSTQTDDDICKPNYLKDSYHECNGIFLDYRLPCNGTCVEKMTKTLTLEDMPFLLPMLHLPDEAPDERENKRLCRGGKCLTESESWECEGECIENDEHCNGICQQSGYVPCGKTCLPEHYKSALESGRYYPCGDQCISAGIGDLHIPCNGTCEKGQALCGDKCIIGDIPCRGECNAEGYSFKCITRSGEEMCLSEKYKLGDGYSDCLDGSDEKCLPRWSCNGKQQCRNKPCHNHDPVNDAIQTICPPSVTKTNRWGDSEEYAMYYCAAHDECRLEGFPCNGTCMLDTVLEGYHSTAREQFACQDESKCISKSKQYDHRSDCPDGSDEIARCRGDIDCSKRILIKDSYPYFNFRCENGETDIMMEKFCDGKEDCEDGSDEVCEKCPGVIKCRNGELVCSNIPCNNTGLNVVNRLGVHVDLTCEQEGWDLCDEGPGDAKCVMSAADGRWSIKARVGETCNGKCLSGIQCGDKCLPQDSGWYQSCNGSCDHINTTKIMLEGHIYVQPSQNVNFQQRRRDPGYGYRHQTGMARGNENEPEHMPTPIMVMCDGYCIEEQELRRTRQSHPYSETLECDGECRVYKTAEQRIKASRRTCQGTCLYGDGDDQWFPCDSGDECFSPEEWCNGVRDCQDGSDEAACQQCPGIKRCDSDSYNYRNKPSHPLVNQTASNGPRFPDYVCVNEPCGDCSDKGTFPCGNLCIPKDQLCPLSGLCSSPTQFRCDKCVEAEAVCDGKADCQDGSDEENCLDYEGSWLCNGVIQSKTKPCLQ